MAHPLTFDQPPSLGSRSFQPCLRRMALAIIAACYLSLSASLALAQPLEPTADASPKSLKTRYEHLSRQLAKLEPEGLYIVVDTARNTVTVRQHGQILLTALASTGSGTVLEKPGQPGAQWVFDTPRGEFKIQSKLEHPVWVKPDWAFLEEGQAVPKNPAERIEPGTLGDYALGFGKGYFIHGTLYPRLLGKNITHGCIRLGDDDLKALFKLAKIGTPLFIF